MGDDGDDKPDRVGSPSEHVKSSDLQIENKICSPSGSLISTTDEDSEISSSICDDNNLPLLSPVCETVAKTSDERKKRVASPCEIRKNVSKKEKKEKLNIKALLQWISELKNSVPEIVLNEEDISPYVHPQHPCVVEDLLFGQRLGTGGSGEVFKCIDKNTNLHMACKRMKMTKYEEGQIGKHELETIKKIGNKEINQYIVEYYYAAMTRRSDHVEFHIFMEYMDTTVTAFYKELHKEARFNPDERNRIIYRLIQNLASALAFLEENDIVHRDIKPDNMLVNKEGQFKLCDLGLCTSRTKLKNESKCVVGTVCYKPPRPAEDPIHDDMWRFGVSLLEICNGKHPYADRYGDSTNEIVAFENEWKPTFETEISPTIRKIILRLLEKEPSHRFNSFRDILEKKGIRKFDCLPSENELNIIHSIINS